MTDHPETDETRSETPPVGTRDDSRPWSRRPATYVVLGVLCLTAVVTAAAAVGIGSRARSGTPQQSRSAATHRDSGKSAADSRPSAAGGPSAAEAGNADAAGPPLVGAAIPGTSIADVKSRLSAKWSLTFQASGPTTYAVFPKPGATQEFQIGMRGAPGDSSERVGLLQCRVRQEQLTMDQTTLDFVESCLAPALTKDQQTAASKWLASNAPSLAAGAPARQQDLGSARLYAVRVAANVFYVRLVGK